MKELQSICLDIHALKSSIKDGEATLEEVDLNSDLFDSLKRRDNKFPQKLPNHLEDITMEKLSQDAQKAGIQLETKAGFTFNNS